jgi:hypothetical protein
MFGDDNNLEGIDARVGAFVSRWCTNRPAVVFPLSRLACQRIRAETGMPRPVIRLSTLQPTFASVR